MRVMASQITDNSTVLPKTYSVKKSRTLHYKPFVCEIYWIRRWPPDSPHKGPVMRNSFPCRDVTTSRASSQYKDEFSGHGDFHYKDETVVGRRSYLYNETPYTGKTTYLYLNGPQFVESISSLSTMHQLGACVLYMDRNSLSCRIRC